MAVNKCLFHPHSVEMRTRMKFRITHTELDSTELCSTQSKNFPLNHIEFQSITKIFSQSTPLQLNMANLTQ